MNTKRALTLAEIDHLIHELGILGIGIDCDGAGERWAWQADRPMLPAEIQAAIGKARNGDPVSPDWLRDMSQQLRMQSKSFTQCADALSANDARKLTMPDGPGLGIKEVRELLDCDLRTTSLTQDAAVHEAHASARGELASLHRIAAGHCERAADAADAFRIDKWRRDYERVLFAEATRTARGITIDDRGAA